MLIECPNCGTRADLARPRAGLRVRCARCGQVYAAARARARGPNRSVSWIYAAIGGVVAVVVIFAVVSSRSTPDPATAQAAEPVPGLEPAPEEGIGWDSYPVQALVALYDAVARDDRTELRASLFGPGLLALERDRDSVVAPDTAAFAALGASDRRGVHERGLGRLLEDDNIKGWKPFDCEVVQRKDDASRVRLAVSPRDPTKIEKRWVEFELARDGERWKAWSWRRWVSADEERTARLRDRNKRVYLSDGSSVLERPLEPLEHLVNTTPELRARIDRLYATMTDLDLTREATAAQHELVAIGRPALPILLTGLHETPLDTHENAIVCNLIVQTLRRITGEYFGYAPQVAEASAVGTTEERQQSSVRQWFAWWHTHEDTFTEKVVEDGLQGSIELTDKERRWLDRHPD